jgi:hypothetical protein
MKKPKTILLKLALVSNRVDTFKITQVTFDEFVVEFAPLDKYKLPKKELASLEEFLGDIASYILDFEGADRLNSLEELGAISLVA